jgi:putative endonuclease
LPFTDLLSSIANRFDRCASAPAPALATTAETGRYGERVAAAFLRGRGYRVLYRNYQITRGEIDLICRCRDVLVFVEVRTRAGEDFGRPAETINTDKREALRRAARRYLGMLGRDDIHYRFDAVEVLLTTGEVPVCTLLTDFFAFDREVS